MTIGGQRGERRLEADAEPLLTTPEMTMDDANSDAAKARRRLAGGSLGPAHIVFMVLAAVTPAGGAVAVLPLAIALGVGVGTPGLFIVCGLILVLFAIGFTRMVPYVKNAGAFYAYVSNGLGKPAGLAAAYVALTSYTAIGAAVLGSLGFFASITVDTFFGVDLAWWIYSLAGLLLCLLLGYLRITFAAKVLAVALTVEAAVVLVLDVAILIERGIGSFEVQAFSPGRVFAAGVLGVGLIYGFSFFQGFEGTAIYAEEAREPDRTVPRATYAAIAIVTVFFVLTSWAMIAGGGGDDAPARALADPGNFAYQLSDTYVGVAWTDTLKVLILTASLAGGLAFHNAASRYIFALARDGFMPASFSRLQPRFSSPSVAGLASFSIMTALVLGFAVAGLDPLTNLASSLTGFGAIGFLSLLTLSSAAVFVFFWRRGQRGWTFTVAPAVATCALAAITVLGLLNYELMTGTSSGLINALPWLHVATVIVAVAIALHAKVRRPAAYQRMGRTIVD